MCLINFNFQGHRNYKLIIAANRDEFYKRPTASARFWEDNPDILAGRDLVGMGTWLGITKSGRIAALTNYRDPNEEQNNKTSRGHIVRSFLEDHMPATEFLSGLQKDKGLYAGFNIIAGSPEQLWYYNNIQNEMSPVPPGTHGLSNEFLDTPWPKVTKGKERMTAYIRKHSIIEIDPLFDLITDAEQAPDERLPNTGVGVELERQLSPLFIKTPGYGTRCSTVLLVDHDGRVTFVERTYDQGNFEQEKRFSFQLNNM
ncbi:NRDE family protein [Lentibacillus salicampi]|uniref:NRDE family protein n=2 Tax=Lentibacillus salicampi TaxID=175306 RepID=A0A4Y9AFZ1_9BACI|nr:NRDE family protein [Lentibacillus salicampi]TFJ93294.1 NRDE family protein [Lentibacillus salicampi]